MFILKNMNFNVYYNFYTSLLRIHSNNFFFKNTASAGLGIWNELTTSHKHKIEKYWSDKIHKSCNQGFQKEKFYVLSMFPYPSGSLHMGHVRVYSISDTIARFYRMLGKNVIHPIGWDAFGLPAENAAIERQINPAVWIKANISIMRQQLHKLGCTFDNHRELTTSDPTYYKWTQELFLKLFENNLLYQKETFVNWDPIDKTVLADEQVDKNNRSWRSGAIVEKKLLKQWFIRTTVFAESLLQGLQDPLLKEWKDIIKIQQHWIGDCTGINIDFCIESNLEKYPKILTLWTDKPEFIEHAKFLAISNSSIFAHIEPLKISDSIKKLNIRAINPFTLKYLPVFITKKEILPFPDFRDDYIGIPCVSQDDRLFCDKVKVQYETYQFKSHQEQIKKRSYIIEFAKEKKIGGHLVSSKLNDWLISRQRYWGTPIPIVHCNKCGSQPIDRNQLPVQLPKLYKRLKKSDSILANDLKWLNTNCPVCKGPALRETDTMDTFVDSSWYFMRYIDPKNQNEMFSKNKAKDYLPVDLYIGGKEHATLHLYYARFISHFLNYLGIVPTKEPFKQLLVQGMVMGQSYCSKKGKYLKPNEVILKDKQYVDIETQSPITIAWEKMSKSKYNGVDPEEMIKEYSTDTIRLIMLGDVAPTSHRNWSLDTFPGILNWQRRLWQIVCEFINLRKKLDNNLEEASSKNIKFEKEENYMFDSRNYYLHGVTFNIKGSQQLSVAISKMQGLTNSLKKVSLTCIKLGKEYERALAVQIIMLAPFAPHFASELWAGFCSAPNKINENSEIQWDKDVLEQEWPQVDMTYALKVRVKVNSKDFTFLRVRRLELDKMTQEDIMNFVMKESKFQKHIENRKIIKINFHAETGCGANINILTKKIL